jgi:WD40 repeat protein
MGASLLTPKWIYQASGADRPSFSPDGSKVVFHVQSGADVSLWIVDADGGNPHRIYPPGGAANPQASRPDWSWSDRIAFGNAGAIWTVDPDGSGAAPYYRGTITPPEGLTYPSWYKDLGAIVAVAYGERAGVRSATLYKLTPHAVEPLTTSPHPCAGRPSVNPDGTRVAFAGNSLVCSQSVNQIWVKEPNIRPHRIEPGDPAHVQGRSPNWSPLGDLIVFSSNRGKPPSEELAAWVMNSDGTNPRRITEVGLHPQWNRQQTKIVLASPKGQIGIVDFRGM